MPLDDARPEEGERTEAPTGQSRETARLAGRAVVSREVGAFFAVLAAVFVLYYAGAWMMMGAAGLMQNAFKAASLRPAGMSLTDVATVLSAATFAFIYIALPIAAIPLAGFLSQMAQTGFMFAPARLTSGVGMLNPFKGFKGLFSPDSVADAVKTILKFTLLGYAVYVGAASGFGGLAGLPALVGMDAATTAVFMGRTVFAMMTKTLWALFVLGALDYAYERWRFERSIMVTRAELKAEVREAEGDPVVRERIRRARAEAVGGK